MTTKGIEIVFFLLIVLHTTTAQDQDWFNKDLHEDNILGVSSDKSHEEFANKSSHEVIVAIIDSGVDIAHEDLKDNVWVNSDEIPGNGIDDDNNGYIDDINGWNFLGGPDGQNVVAETYGEVREYRALRDYFAEKDTFNLSESDAVDFLKMKTLLSGISSKAKAAEKELSSISGFEETLTQIRVLLHPYVGTKTITSELLQQINPTNEGEEAAKSIMTQLLDNGFDEVEYKKYKDYQFTRLNYHYNIDFDPRDMIGDNPDDPYENNYGNNDVNGGHAEHGTHVAGIIGAVRGNDLGISGVANDVKLMILRAVPDGDERDKDIANSILYAVDNGAKVINMSFGKGYSPHKGAIDEAVQYAASKEVLIIHAAGNAGLDIDEAIHYPVRTFLNGEKAQNWLEVGASSQTPNELLIASFSNYGRIEVDLFAPGLDMRSTVPKNGYESNSGTSMASPVVAGIAAAIWSYFPDFSAVEVKNIIRDAALPYGKSKVLYPNAQGERKKKTKFRKLSSTGGVANLYEALKLAEKRYHGEALASRN